LLRLSKNKGGAILSFFQHAAFSGIRLSKFRPHNSAFETPHLAFKLTLNHILDKF